jgi:hypothetical protein
LNTVKVTNTTTNTSTVSEIESRYRQ